MNTVKLFQENVYLTNFSATIEKILPQDETNLLVLDQTAFFPIGGGQNWDLGTINQVAVSEVFEKDGLIFHRVPKQEAFKEGDFVLCCIDWPHRFKNMQSHCGEHILSGVFFKEYGGVNRGFHMSEASMTIDISLEENPNFTSVTWDMALHAEKLANQIIWKNVPVITRHFDSQEEASKLPLRKALALEEDITIVCVGSIENPSDCVACCGTHPKSAGEVGLIKILKVENNKGMFRIYFKAGEDAFSDYQEKHEIITKLNIKYSASTIDLLEKIAVQEEKNKEFRSQLNLLKQILMKERLHEIETALAASSNMVSLHFEGLKIDDLLKLGRSVSNKISKLLLLTLLEESTVLLFSNGKTVDCGKLVKDTAHIYNGKGGGNDTQARAIFPKAENIPTYIDLIEKHLR